MPRVKLRPPPPPYGSEDGMSEVFQAAPENVQVGDPTLSVPFEGSPEFSGNSGDWGPWCENVDSQLKFLNNEFDRLENGVFQSLAQQALGRLDILEEGVDMRLEQFWDRNTTIHAESSAQLQNQIFASETRLAEHQQMARTDMENLIVASVREKETRLLAEFQQHRAAQMEYMEKRMHELITQSTHEIVAEILLKINATGQSGSPPTVSEIVASFQETNARELEKAIADLALKIEVGAATSVQPADLKCLADVLRN